MKKIRRVIRDSETNITGTFIVGNKYMYRGEKCEEYISGTEYEFICGIKCACGCQGYKLLFRGETGLVPFISSRKQFTDINGVEEQVMTALSNGSSANDWYSEEEMSFVRETDQEMLQDFV